MLTKIRNMPLTDKMGWVGVGLLQGATLPAMISNIMGWSDKLPPLSMVLMVWLGLICYFYRAYVQRDVVYMTSNGIGLVLNTILLALIALPLY
jgi:hypothetical protein